MLFFFKFLLLCIVSRLNADKTIVVDFENGKVEGSVITSKSGFKVDAFLGIQYGKVPERFSKPIPVEPWKDVKQAKKLPLPCIQTFVFGDPPMTLPDGEDCLYLNLFAPHETQKVSGGYPVMVFIHGGGYQMGSTLEYGVDGITEWVVPKGVVFINFHYRLGIWGFFSTGTNEAKGNYGLWDQSLLLTWVKDNVAHFGGNPNKITVFGESAGSFSTSLQSLSPQSRDLFQNIILMSGSALTPWFVGETSVDLSLKVAKNLGCTDNQEILTCLRSKSNAEISAEVTKLQEEGPVAHTFVPRIDDDFFPKSTLKDLIKNAPPKLTIMGGVNEEMGFMVTPTDPHIISLWTVKNPKSFTIEQMRQHMRAIFVDQEFPDPCLLTELATYHYVDSHGSRDNGTFITQAYSEFLSDFFFITPIIQEAHLRSESGSKVWLYEFDYFNPKFAPGSFHFYDLWYVFKMAIYRSPVFSDEELKVANYYTTLLTNFAKYGNPTEKDVGGVQWEPIDKQFPDRYLKIDARLEMGNYMKRSALAFWNELLPLLKKRKSKGCTKDDAHAHSTKKEEL